MANLWKLEATLAIVGCAALVALATVSTAADPPAAVTVQLFQFQPSPLATMTGSTVSWTNQDDITHTVTSGTPDRPDGRFRVQLDGTGAAGSVEFPHPGVYPYFCERHQSMRGEIRVN